MLLGAEMTVEDFEHEPCGPHLVNFWHARPRVSTPFGEFQIEAHMPPGDTSPPDPSMILQANELAEFTRAHPDAVLDKIYEHYTTIAAQPEWMESCGVPPGLRRDELAPYLDEMVLVIDRDETEPTIYVVPRWDNEHAIYLAVRDGRVEFQDL
jgi:hypothetical protein